MASRRPRFFGLGLIILLLSWSVSLHAQQSVNLDSSVRVKITRPSFKKATKTFISSVTVKNITKSTINGPLWLVVTSISLKHDEGRKVQQAGGRIALVNAQGQTSSGIPFVSVSLPATGLRAGKSTPKISLQFSNSTHLEFTFTVSVLAGASPAAYAVGGTISGLAGSGLVLQNNGGNNLSVAAGATTFTFATPVTGGMPYIVTVLTQPTNPSQTCLVTNASGTVSNSNITSVAVSCTTTSTNTPSTQELIAQALADGRIDLATSLVYRMWALFLDGQLPSEYDGPGLGTEDTSLFDEIHVVWDTLPADAQAALQPYLLRPDDPGSPFTANGATGAPLRPPVRPSPRARLRQPASVPSPSATPCDAWSFQNANGAYVKVHVCQSADPAQDQAILTNVINILDFYWDEITADMGAPRHDNGAGGDDRIDAYVIDLGSCIYRANICEPTPIPTNGDPAPDAVAPR